MTRAAEKPTHRTDADIFTEARNALDRHPGVPGTVRVHLNQGVATLTGSVRWPAERAEAEEAVRQVSGVQRIVNNITVARVTSPEGFEAPDDRS